ncbi:MULTISPECIES: amino-acid N-acetyltransferase [Pseudomonadaceae]|jgi:amino-acid N-acetyltransferase|uniref:Amino-acid acetyltransferase n=1 Tax=Ectopseudomonas mendocina (strain ymp) TaxID=399739 RepID=ARGA_ECTM1|nr:MULTISPECIES: amino-acid N-acetyltransferase [Pseudomonas]A4XP61.1 RecName: Full=Amino-acid acetyltransferase; AltName: Full=N-acetylglutamate synthase; Short=AGS; Short=NAGS [Pseudomonas mendocina ymp]ARS47224.1 N-acetylglutamate synthase [Pseudomonas mendocina]EJO92303.1 N-acetylglutamate synthase [Pseudomonas mendocina DLHK]ATH84050.1 N-acetylglutamate synthase [Pseudomonas mendocina]MBA4244787.1 N-acetylglutamate synthase [Pseudomonas sp.]MBF8160157.1 amino-acid N-acetyltransferase [Ps
MHDYVTWLRHASPYINAHRDRTFVVMLPGEGIAHPNFANIVHDLVLLHSLGVRLVLVHGSRPQIEARLAARGLTPHFHRDLRITDAPTLECVIDAVGQLRIAIEARLSMDMAASPMQGSRLRLTSGNFVTARPIGVLDGVDYHHTGEVRRIDRKGINRQLDERSIVLLSPLGYSPTGEIFNLACEDVATRAAIDLGADKLLLFGAEDGLLDEHGQLVRELRPQQVPAHLARLGSNYQGELLDAAAQACRGGVGRSHIVSYATDGALLSELFTRTGNGTLVAQEQFESLREATIEDVGGLIELISPLEEQGILVRRSREVLEREIEQFSIVEREGLIIACAALYPIADSDCGELACLAVNPDYRHGGRGDELLARIEARARAQGLKTLFVLTTRTAHWFRERGFEPSSVERMPAARASLYNYQRNSKVFEKAL